MTGALPLAVICWPCGTLQHFVGFFAMNETLRQLGLELRRRSQAILRRPMNWRMIDTVVRLEETEEQRAREAKRARGNSQDLRDDAVEADTADDGLIWRAANDDDDDAKTNATRKRE